ncbi:hypothetical protein ACHMW6_00120 (plasmid) [Pseudoduganella sp. UC29_106]|uniref:hypothetical protein n=1 Tax=Pseudoduganella sp. UC29_106 TaxID=3374553 RepID=UPI003756DDA9
MSKRTAVAKIKGNISVDGIRTIFEADGTTVKDQRAVLRMGQGIFSKRFLVPMTLLKLEEVTAAMSAKEGEFFLPDTELKLKDVTAVHGTWRTYEANLVSMITPLPRDTLKQLVNSQTIVKTPK